jgi:hypothetical protein
MLSHRLQPDQASKTSQLSTVTYLNCYYGHMVTNNDYSVVSYIPYWKTLTIRCQSQLYDLHNTVPTGRLDLKWKTCCNSNIHFNTTFKISLSTASIDCQNHTHSLPREIAALNSPKQTTVILSNRRDP